MKKFLFFGITAILAIFLISACSISSTDTHSSKLQKGSPKRIISLAPSITEILFALGLNNSIVGVTDYCNYPPEALNKTKIGGFVNTNIETVVALNPDIVIATKDGNNKMIVEKLKSLNISVEVVNTQSINDIFTSITQIAKHTFCEDKGKALIADLERQIEKIKTKTKNKTHPKILMVFGHNPLIVAGPNTFANELIELSGGENLAKNAKTSYPAYSLEQIINEDPDFILEASMITSENEKVVTFWHEWPNLKAVKQNKIYFLDSDIVTRPGPRISIALEKLFEIIHPEKG
ncbi:MAG: cobalamin-binding protein [Candidatus Firestonebacteria bacterium]|nr:cobalamin-binding protein [Candidatus Firestonebacteria bacterium]